VTITDTSALYGRVVATSLLMQQDAAMFYDPALDTGGGFTNPSSELYDEAGRILATFKNLAQLNDADIQAAANLEKVKVKAKGEKTAPLVADPIDPVDPLDPTPRPVDVTVDLASFGKSVADWESGG
jgi:hypothetical protein